MDQQVGFPDAGLKKGTAVWLPTMNLSNDFMPGKYRSSGGFEEKLPDWGSAERGRYWPGYYWRDNLALGIAYGSWFVLSLVLA